MSDRGHLIEAMMHIGDAIQHIRDIDDEEIQEQVLSVHETLVDLLQDVTHVMEGL